MKHTHAQLPFVQLDEVILTVSDGFTDWAASTVRRTDSDRIATAAFIVRACNAHYELIAALEAALKTAEFEKHPYRPWQERARHAIARTEGE